MTWLIIWIWVMPACFIFTAVVLVRMDRALHKQIAQAAHEISAGLLEIQELTEARSDTVDQYGTESAL